MVNNQTETEQALHMFRVFSRAYQSVSEYIQRDIKSHGLHPTEFAVLELLYNQGPQPLQKIGSAILLASGSITYVVDKLEKNGMLKRQPCPKDRRVTHAVLTEDGQALMDRIFPLHAEAIQKGLHGLNSEEKQQVITLLKKMGMTTQELLK
jgi:MarR family transcriptional regulator, 2-MHQ and catechol-resistance regulon repressor